jgi:hypothetical protein
MIDSPSGARPLRPLDPHSDATPGHVAHVAASQIRDAAARPASSTTAERPRALSMFAEPALDESVAFGSLADLRRAMARAAEARAASDALDARRSADGRGEHDDESSRASHEAEGWRALMRASLTAFVRRMRDDGLASERVLEIVRASALDARPRTLAHRSARALLEDALRWTLEAYQAE